MSDVDAKRLKSIPLVQCRRVRNRITVKTHGYKIIADYKEDVGRWLFSRDTDAPTRGAHFSLRSLVHFALNEDLMKKEWEAKACLQN